MDVTVSFAGDRRVEAAINGTVITADQPVQRGGRGTAPSPFDLFLASIATCSGYYVYDFCLKREIPIEGISLVMSTERSAETRMLVEVSIEIRVPPHFPEKYEKAVIRATELCSVKKHIVEPPVFETFVARSG